MLRGCIWLRRGVWRRIVDSLDARSVEAEAKFQALHKFSRWNVYVEFELLFKVSGRPHIFLRPSAKPYFHVSFKVGGEHCVVDGGAAGLARLDVTRRQGV